MAMMWAFDVEAVARRSLVVGWIKECLSVKAMHAAVEKGRGDLSSRRLIRPVEDLPRHADMSLYRRDERSPQFMSMVNSAINLNSRSEEGFDPSDDEVC